MMMPEFVTKPAEKGDAKLMKIMAGHFQKAVREPEEFVKFYMCENDPQTWFILITNLSGKDGELEGGEYLFRMWAPPKFPFEPPKFTALTPNGVYDIKQSICISVGEYHKDQYQAVLGMGGFAKEMANGIMTWNTMGHGIGIIHMQNTVADKRRWAKESRAYNLKNYGNIMASIESTFSEYARKWDLTKMEPRLAKRLGLVKEPVAEDNAEDEDEDDTEDAEETEDTAAVEKRRQQEELKRQLEADMAKLAVK
jgi:ubiquitin-protein ligase